MIRGPSPGGGAGKVAKGYTHPDQTLLMRPEVGTQAQFRKKKPPQTYRYDSSLSPALDWDGGNGARELGEWLLGVIERAAGLPAPHVLPSPAEFKASDGRVTVSVHSLQEAVDQLKRLGRPFLDWAGKAERLSFDVPTLPLFVHERLSTKAIVETLAGHVVQSGTAPIQRCLLMTSDPGDLVLDPTCGSGTTAYVAEQWGRRWITIDTSRVPLALTRQRLLTATFPYYELKEQAHGPSGGFVYKRKQNNKGEEVGA